MRKISKTVIMEANGIAISLVGDRITKYNKAARIRMMENTIIILKNTFMIG
jgi:hypothetical protein